MEGFLGTGAEPSSDINLTVQVLMGLSLLGGMVLARRKHYLAHGICQSSVMLLNLVMIFWVMLPAFWSGVTPELPGALHQAYYYVPTLHATLGIIAQLLGLYIVLRAGTNFLPKFLCFNDYKLWMRTELTLWWIVIVLGVATYLVWL